MINSLLLVLFLPATLSATSPVVNRYLPNHTAPEAPLRGPQRAAVNVSMSAAHAAKSFGQEITNTYIHHFDGLLEIGGRYDLQNLINAAEETITCYTAPFRRETGGDAWINQQLEFAAKSSLSAYGVHVGLQVPLGSAGWMVGADVPFWHCEARQRYSYPITQNSQHISLPDREQVHRFRQYVHNDIGLKPGDWVRDSIGDTTGWVQWARCWQYVWLLRSVQFGSRIGVSVPTSGYPSTDFPSSVPVGGDGHWGCAFSVLPSCELKEGLHIGVPCTVALQAPHTRNRRIPTYAEAAAFSPLVGRAEVRPGATIRVAPYIAVEHLVENVHFSLSYVRTKHFADTWYDKRPTVASPSYLTRDTLPVPVVGMTDAVTQAFLNANRGDKKERTSWESSYLSFDVEYQAKSFLSRGKNAPFLRLVFDYCLSGDRVARTHKISGHIGWRF